MSELPLENRITMKELGTLKESALSVKRIVRSMYVQNMYVQSIYDMYLHIIHIICTKYEAYTLLMYLMQTKRITNNARSNKEQEKRSCLVSGRGYHKWDIKDHKWYFSDQNQSKKVINLRVWSWLRMNAGGVPNTCKSNGVILSEVFGWSEIWPRWRTGE